MRFTFMELIFIPNKMDKVLLPQEIEIENIEFGKPEKNDGFHYSKIKEPVLFQTPPIELSGFSENNSIELAVKDEKQEKCYRVFKDIEKHTVGVISNNSKEWFNKNIPKEKIQEMMEKCASGNVLKIRRDKQVKVFDDEKNESDLESLDQPIVNVIKFGGIVFGKNKCFLDIKIVQINKVKVQEEEDEENIFSTVDPMEKLNKQLAQAVEDKDIGKIKEITFKMHELA